VGYYCAATWDMESCARRAIRPLARLGYMDYTNVPEVFSMPSYADQASLVGEAVANRTRAAAQCAASKSGSSVCLRIQ
jgi:hypothetical protein